jgi:hypothetical protein
MRITDNLNAKDNIKHIPFLTFVDCCYYWLLGLLIARTAYYWDCWLLRLLTVGCRDY